MKTDAQNNLLMSKIKLIKLIYIFLSIVMTVVNIFKISCKRNNNLIIGMDSYSDEKQLLYYTPRPTSF